MDHDEEHQPHKKVGKLHNVLPLWGNEATMNLNPLILTNIQSSSYFKVSLFKLKTYHEVVDEIYYQVKHLEPWEKGSRKTAGQTGMCGGVRGVGAGGIVSTAFCLLYKLYTLRLTRKQVNGLLGHTDSPYIRALGFMYIRFSQPPSDLYDWYEDYLQDEEEIDLKAGGGQTTTIGQMLRQWLVKLDWFTTLFPRIPVPIQKLIEKRLDEYLKKHNLDNRLTFAEKEMNRRRGEEREFFEEKNSTNSVQQCGGTGFSGNGTGRERSDREYFNDDQRSSGREREQYRNVERERDDRRDHSRSRERHRDYRDSGRDREKDYSRYRGGERDRYRERDTYKDREYSRDNSKYSTNDRDKGRATSNNRERERKYR